MKKLLRAAVVLALQGFSVEFAWSVHAGKVQRIIGAG